MAAGPDEPEPLDKPEAAGVPVLDDRTQPGGATGTGEVEHRGRELGTEPLADEVRPHPDPDVQHPVGLGQTQVTEAAKGDQPLDRQKAFDALGASVVEEYGEWKPEGAPMDSFRRPSPGIQPQTTTSVRWTFLILRQQTDRRPGS